jgi:hypothetical protein
VVAIVTRLQIQPGRSASDREDGARSAGNTQGKSRAHKIANLVGITPERQQQKLA